MALTHILSQRVTAGGQTITIDKTVEADQELNYEVTVPAETTDHLVAAAIDVSQIKSLYITSDKALVIQTNDGTTPADTITLVAGDAVLWYDGNSGGIACPLTTDVTALYVTNAGAAAATLRIRALVDATV